MNKKHKFEVGQVIQFIHTKNRYRILSFSGKGKLKTAHTLPLFDDADEYPFSVPGLAHALDIGLLSIDKEYGRELSFRKDLESLVGA